MPLPHNPIDVFTTRLKMIADLPDAVCDDLAGVVASLKSFDPDQDIVRQGDKPSHCCVILEGWVGRTKIADNEGRRQITAVHFAGTAPDLQSMFVPLMDHGISALTHVKVAYIAHASLRELMQQHPALMEALWKETLVDAAISREWEVNLGARPAVGRIAHLFCEVGTRLTWFGQARRAGNSVSFEWPINQVKLAEMTGLSAVHVNRSLQFLRAKGAIHDDKKVVTIPSLTRLAELAGFNTDYLLAELPRQ